MILKWYYTDCHKTEEEALGKNGQEYLITKVTSKFWFRKGDTDPIGRKGNKSALKILAQRIENERCGDVGLLDGFK